MSVSSLFRDETYSRRIGGGTEEGNTNKGTVIESASPGGEKGLVPWGCSGNWGRSWGIYPPMTLSHRLMAALGWHLFPGTPGLPTGGKVDSSRQRRPLGKGYAEGVKSGDTARARTAPQRHLSPHRLWHWAPRELPRHCAFPIPQTDILTEARPVAMGKTEG